jgi:CRP-like cAMP-binding protein
VQNLLLEDDNDKHSTTSSQEEENKGFFTIAALSDGHAFGELALIQQKPRMATVRASQKSHIMILTKEAFEVVIGKMEKRILNDKINFLRSIPVFALLTKNSIAKITCSLSKKIVPKDMYLYKENDPAKSVFIVINGELEVTKTITYKTEVVENVGNIFKAPLKANKKTNIYFSKNSQDKHLKMNVRLT